MAIYNVGFFNLDDGRDDETQFDVSSMEELYEMFSEFCAENELSSDTSIDYIELAEEI